MGASRFYISLEDDLMRLFGGERIYNMMEMLKVEEDIPLETPEEEEVPLAETPQTGDNTVIWFAWVALLVIVIAALIADKKCKS